MSIEVRNLKKAFGDYIALGDVNLHVATGELVALLGPSGAGKTTLLRVIAGLEQADSGQVYFHGQDTTDTALRERGVGFVFQHYALFRHMTVLENVAFGLRVRPRQTRPTDAEIRRRVMKLLDLVHLGGLSDRYPSQLSGGQRQRVALARALAVEPKVLLLDEPFGSLDAKVRMELRRWLRRLHDELHTTSVFVTHDQEEAMEVADRVVIMNRGKIEQEGTPEQVYYHPANSFVYNFIGNVNLFSGRVEGGKAYFGRLSVPLPEVMPDKGDSAKIYVRPHLLDLQAQPNGLEHFTARVEHIHPTGALVKVELVSEWGEPFQVELSHERYRALTIARGSEVYVTLKNETMFVETAKGDGMMFGEGI
ncbi:MAG: sulfate ABC transporter ATP-binding protein [Candidatus Eisenbacteria bacterium]